MYSIKSLQEIFEEALEKERFDYQPLELYQPISYTLGLGGKRMRPVLTLMACDLFKGNLKEALKPAIGIEMFHNFTLLHDDIMDQAPVRRGKPSVYRKWNTNIAILSGDTMFAKAYTYIASVKDETLRDILNIFTKTAVEVCEGQQYDMNFESRNDVTIEEYLEMIRLKTAVLPACSLLIGALVGGSGIEEAEKMYDLGIRLGLAFQLRDDYLDMYADEDEFGKKTGNDILSSKKTYLYLKAVEVAKQNIKEDLIQVYNSRSLDDHTKIESVKTIFNDLTIKDLTNQQISFYSDMASKQLDSVEVDEERKVPLRTFIEQLMDRSY